jgi:hypothetical protein
MVSFLNMVTLLCAGCIGYGIGELTNAVALPAFTAQLEEMYSVEIQKDGIQHFLSVIVIALFIYQLGTPGQKGEGDFVNFILVGLGSALWPWSVWVKIGMPVLLIAMHVTRKELEQDKLARDKSGEHSKAE